MVYDAPAGAEVTVDRARLRRLERDPAAPARAEAEEEAPTTLSSALPVMMVGSGVAGHEGGRGRVGTI